MTQRVKSFVKRSTTAVQMANLGNLRQSIHAHRPTLSDNEFPGMNSYMGESFFDKENFRSILECLDGGK